MNFVLKTDLIPLFDTVVSELQSHAQAQDIILEFKSEVEELSVSYNPEKVVSEITVLLNNVINFTPKSCRVYVRVGHCTKYNGKYKLIIENTGVNLSKIGEIIASVSSGLSIEKPQEGTRFMVDLPIVEGGNVKIDNSSKILLPKQYPDYYSTIHKRLTNHFDKIENIQALVDKKGLKEGAFLKKVNVIIRTNLENAAFTVDDLAKAMALSRAQLFRKVKGLTQMSPSAYLRFTRLHEAKRLLQNENEDFNVTEVSYHVGFSNVSHFTRSFKRQFGMSPSSFLS